MAVFRRHLQDALTGLPNRASFVSRAAKVLAKHDTSSYSIAYLRLVNLGTYNLRQGATAGDDVLKMVADKMRRDAAFEVVGRFESGSFGALAPANAVERLLDEINQSISSRGEANRLVLKAGYCPMSPDLTVEDAMRRARYAYEDIRIGSPAYSRLFDSGLETVYNRRAYVVEHLDDAIERGEIRAYPQPIVRVLTGMICEVEILARWESEEFGFLRPDEFVPELERHQLIHRLDAEVVRLACKQWSDASAMGINVPFGINLSRLDFELCDMYAIVTNHMRTYDVPKEQVHIEITESALAQSSDMLMAGVARFRQAGFELYLDDFGSGYSSLRVLEGKSFDVVKLDMSLLREVEENERARVIVADAISMVKRLNLQTLCEGVETEEQYLFLKAVGCEKAQGYYFARPMNHDEAIAHLQETADSHETAEDKRYYDSVGRVNLMDGTRSSVHGVEAAHFMATQPFAIVEIRGQSLTFLCANSAFNRLVNKSVVKTLAELESRLTNDMSTIRNKVLYATSKALRTGIAQRFDFVFNGNFLTVGMSHVESSRGRDAFLLEVISVTKYSQFSDFKLLEDSTRFLYTIFKRIDLLDVTDNTWRNIYLNVPRYNALRAGSTPQDEIDAVCTTFIHPDDRERFLAFYDLDTVDERLSHLSSAHLADVFFALSDNDRFEEQLFMLIPVSMNGHKQFLSCMRDLDTAGLVRQRSAGQSPLSDEVLLSGILDVTDRYIYWKDAKRRYLGANQQYLDFYGFDGVESLLGKTDEDLGFVRNVHFRPDEERVLRGSQIRSVAGITRNGAGELRDIEVSKMPLWNEGEVIGLVGFFVDKGPHDDGETL